MTQYKLLFSSILCFALAMLSLESQAFSSVAIVKGHSHESFYSSYNHDSQKEANKYAVAGCREVAKKNGIGDMAKSCAVVEESNIPGYGAVACGEDNCAWALGYYDVKEAMDAAYFACSESSKNCNEKDIKNWEDAKGSKGFKNVDSPVNIQNNTQSTKM
jgi:hypothetical protein